MGCSQALPQDRGSSNPMDSSSCSSKLAIWGDYFNQDTRALLAICDMAEIQHEFRLVDSFQRQNLTQSYRVANPTQSIPMITDGLWKIIGQSQTSYEFLVEHYPNVKKKFFSPEQANSINENFIFLDSEFRRVSGYLTQTIVNKKVHCSSKPYDLRKLEKCLETFNQILTTHFEAKLDKQAYLTGQRLTYVDIVASIEIETVLLMYQTDIPFNCSNLQCWQDQLSQEPAINSVNREFLKLVQDWDLYAPLLDQRIDNASQMSVYD